MSKAKKSGKIKKPKRAKVGGSLPGLPTNLPQGGKKHGKENSSIR